jgi:hypothetical protein
MCVARPSTRGTLGIKDKCETTSRAQRSWQYGRRTHEQRTQHGAHRVEKGSAEEGSESQAGQRKEACREETALTNMFRVVLECDAEGLPPEIAEQAIIDIAEEFSHRPWHTHVRCSWDGHLIRLEAENDYDEKGLALSDEFSDALTASVAIYKRLGDIRVVSVNEL